MARHPPLALAGGAARGAARAGLVRLAAQPARGAVSAGCGKHVFYPRVVCPHCGADKLEWVAASGTGVVYSTTVVRRKPEAGGDYNVAVIDLAEGPRMMSRVVDLEPTAVKIGMKVNARVAVENDARIVEFTPAQ